ncbi:hypothetical protein OOK48_35060 [Streptomyces viridodiastaticus]|uniref:hypothetical protein n=1 Tax=Streptomyces albogriseolus TaxID=1887 RepID=UPI00225AA581|nr:hypothetical protein [Streptomyces viridodiastaticus]MCX4571542.1 hypothetical protein [Streptomyces viridodiastaticus]
MDQKDIESILWDCVTEPTEDNSHLGYQTSGISKLAELIVEQNRRISELETKVAELSAARTDKQEESPS